MADVQDDEPRARLFGRLVGNGFKDLQERLATLAIPSAVVSVRRPLLVWMAREIARLPLNDLLVRNIGPIMVHLMESRGSATFVEALHLLREFIPVTDDVGAADATREPRLLLPFFRVSEASMSKELAFRFADYSHRRSSVAVHILDSIVELLNVMDTRAIPETLRHKADLMSSGLRQFLYDCKDVFHNIKMATPVAARRRTLASLCHVMACIGEPISAVAGEVSGRCPHCPVHRTSPDTSPRSEERVI